MIVTIHQPEHLPWLGFFDKAEQSDVLVLLDSVPYRKNYFQNRNRIRSSDGSMWLTVPVVTRSRFGQSICEIGIDNRTNPKWRQKHWSSIVQHYRKADFWESHSTFFEQLYSKDWELLADINEAIIRHLIQAFGLPVQVIRSSDMPVEGQRTELLVSICKYVGADTYLSGISGKTYLELEQFAAENIGVKFQEFHHPIYRQLYEPFLPCMSSIDLLFNHGGKSYEILKGINVETVSTVFE